MTSSILLPNTPEYRKAQRQYLKATKNRPQQEWTPFRAAEKKFKARFPPPDFSSVLDLACLDHHADLGHWKGSLSAVEFVQTPLRTGGNRKAFAIPRIPGAPHMFANQLQDEINDHSQALSFYLLSSRKRNSAISLSGLLLNMPSNQTRQILTFIMYCPRKGFGMRG